jgi:hypothetical protein
MTAIHILVLFIVFMGTFVTLGALLQSRRAAEAELVSQADRRRAIHRELRLVR